MDSHQQKSSWIVSNAKNIRSPRIHEKDEIHESKISNPSRSKVEQKLENFRTRFHGYSLTTEPKHATKVSITEPLKPMRYVCYFNVAVSLKKSRLLRFLIYFFF